MTNFYDRNLSEGYEDMLKADIHKYKTFMPIPPMPYEEGFLMFPSQEYFTMVYPGGVFPMAQMPDLDAVPPIMPMPVDVADQNAVPEMYTAPPEPFPNGSVMPSFIPPAAPPPPPSYTIPVLPPIEVPAYVPPPAEPAPPVVTASERIIDIFHTQVGLINRLRKLFPLATTQYERIQINNLITSKHESLMKLQALYYSYNSKRPNNEAAKWEMPENKPQNSGDKNKNEFFNKLGEIRVEQNRLLDQISMLAAEIRDKNKAVIDRIETKEKKAAEILYSLCP